MTDLICVGQRELIDGTRYLLITLSTGEKKEVSQLPTTVSFNSNKFKSSIKKNKQVYTVLCEVYTDYTDGVLLGYLISDADGNISISLSRDLEEIAQKQTVMNYGYVANTTKCYMRRNSGQPHNSMSDKDVKRVYNLSFRALNLTKTMTKEEIAFCMEANKFKLGYQESFTYAKGIVEDSVYFNNEGTLIFLSYLDGRSLDYFAQTCVRMVYLDSKLYAGFAANHRYDMGSSAPITTPDNSNLIIFSNSDLTSFMRISRESHTYSKPCVPFYKSPMLEGILYLLHLSVRQVAWLQDHIDLKTPKNLNLDLGIYMRVYIGMHNVSRYSKELQSFYSEYLKHIEYILMIAELRKVHRGSGVSSLQLQKYIKTVCTEIDAAFAANLI